MRYQKYIFFLVLLFLPTQLGKHFWPNFSYVLGQRIDYLSPTVYLTDILIAILFLSDFKKVYRFFKEHFIGLLGCWVTGLLLSFFWIFFQNQSIGLLFYKWLKLFEFLFFIFWIKKNVKMEEILLPLSLGVLGESLLAWLEFLTQGSLGFWILGERSFHISTPGIALANLQGRLALRPYATFPHPNVLAGYTLVVLIFALFLREQSKFLRLLTLILGTSVIFISFSRTVWTVWFLIIIFWLWIRKKDLALPSLFFLSLGNESVWRRLELTDAAFKIFKTSPIFGVGLGNFITQLPKFLVPKKLYFWQPVHNIFLLILAETGIIGVCFMVYGVWFIFRKLWQEKNLALLYSFFAIILTGFFDHYWLTLQQTQLLLALIIGLSIKSKNVLE
ncbi:O-antigen ligase family protein [Candidatus Microgenomates bacterium]|nr:O-antigen ligase family protein [Candidatus Microgenomates bacterium]